MPNHKLKNVREKISLLIWDNRTLISRAFSILSLLVTSVALLSIISYYGFPVSQQSFYWSQLILKASFSFYTIKYLFSILLNFRTRAHLKKTWFEGMIIFLVTVNFILIYVFNYHVSDTISDILNLPHFNSNSWIFTQVLFLVFVFIEISKASRFLSVLNLGPSALMLLSFVVLILSGSFLLMLPEMTTNGIRYIDALFTSTSACCVTGLTSVDTATCFTVKENSSS